MGKFILLIFILLVTVYSVWKGLRHLRGTDEDIAELGDNELNNKEDGKS